MTRRLPRPRHPLPAHTNPQTAKCYTEAEFAARLPLLNHEGIYDYDKQGRRILP